MSHITSTMRQKSPLRLHGSDHVLSHFSDSPKVLVALILELCDVGSVVDVGCGTGAFLAEFAAKGVLDYLGVDGHHIPAESLMIPASRFKAHDLAAPLNLGRRFDLVVSLEVAEHLPESAADTFIRSLTAAGDVVVFSAAIPFQTGPGHVNEQWPGYWAQRFAGQGLVALDCLRPHLWDRSDVAPYYCQNVFVYAAADAVSRLRTNVKPGFPRSMVHPDFWEGCHETPSPPGARALPAYVRFHAAQVGRSIARAVQTRVSGRHE
jgi:SAM-dependent methyltransferase